ncbi:hypothetical protein [Lentzea sp. NPDC051838]|uniref:hypothetical protein n=1 Tax=Lentzea sp. NPDC051838 TaxID=3154849 RepID=UPI00341E15EE
MEEGYYGTELNHENWKARTHPWTSVEEVIEWRRKYRPRIYPLATNFVERSEDRELDAFGDIMHQLPSVDLDFAIELFSTMAVDEDPVIRKAAAFNATSLYQADQEVGMALFIRTFNDLDHSVRGRAWWSVERAIQEGHISEEDAAPILREYDVAYERALIRDGRAKLKVVSDDPPTASSD